ncbi:hypothetical protein B484DRAFT_468008 [Ochromonadaceae sp. CCMP2298]|nr:hypothetical protein B484DRAFT_468008 [Ochromonadaceae sp. CCMP2298]
MRAKIQEQEIELEDEMARIGRRDDHVQELKDELEEERARVGRWNAIIEAQETELEELRGQVGWKNANLQQQEMELGAESVRAGRRDNLRDEIAELRGEVSRSYARLQDVEDEIGELKDEANGKEHGMGDWGIAGQSERQGAWHGEQAQLNLDDASNYIASQQAMIEQLQEEGKALRRALDTRSESERNSDNGAAADEMEQLAHLRQDLCLDLAARSRCGSKSSPASAEDSADGSPREDRAVTETLRGAADALCLGTEEAEVTDEIADDGKEDTGNWIETEEEAEQAEARWRVECVAAENDEVWHHHNEDA